MSTRTTRTAECYCGSRIEYRALPAELAKAAKTRGIWVHTTSGEMHCYVDGNGIPEDAGCVAKPVEP